VAKPELLQVKIGYKFRKPELLTLALTHPSMTHEIGAAHPHNQRLEFLGDSVLGLVLTRALYDRFPRVDEGSLTQTRARLINAKTVADRARRIDLGQYVIMSWSEEGSGGRSKQSVLADGYEALVGAIFVDGGLDPVEKFILATYDNIFPTLEITPNLENPKGELQEIFQAQSPVAPKYSLLGTSGPDHERSFECVVAHLGKELGRGTGRSKKEAESAAAADALATLRDTLNAKHGYGPVKKPEPDGADHGV
jgi:ribonuclease-3